MKFINNHALASLAKGLLCGAFLMGSASLSAAKSFEQSFNDSTLRVDYIFGGNAKNSNVYLRNQSKWKGWAGRRVNMAKVPYQGNGMVTVIDTLSRDTIYRTSFSSLFQEWQSTDEATQTSKGFENSFLVPIPKRPAFIKIELFNNRHQTVASNTHLYTPNDILVKEPDSKRSAKYSYIHKATDPSKAIDVAILAEGYTEKEMGQFMKHARETVEAIFSHDPFKHRKNDFNFIAVMSPSTDSGVAVPRKKEWRETAMGSNFDTFYSARYLTTSNVFKIFDQLSGIPFEHIIILANTDVYGGGGIYNSYTLTTARHANFRPVVVHEFGHSFGGLADEYFYEKDVMTDTYPLDIEPWEPNITTMVDFGSKWKSQIPQSTPVPTPVADAEKYPIGAYEGGGYSFHGIYRPADHCRMRDNDTPAFCPACQSALERLINFYTKQQ